MKRFTRMNETSDAVSDLKYIREFVRGAIGDKRSGFNNIPLIRKPKLIRLLSITEEELNEHAPYYSFDPWIKAFISARNRCFSPMVTEWDLKRWFRGSVDEDFFIDALKHFTSLDDFKSSANRLRKAQKKRENSTTDYINALINKYSRLTVVRIDLHVKNSLFNANYVQDLLDIIKVHWSNMRRDLNESKCLPRNVGFISSLELGHAVGFHIHLMVFFDGSIHQEDINLARMIGTHWNIKVTEGKGWHYNCNANKDKYKKLGIGRIEYWDKESISNLETTALYLCKADCLLDAVIGQAQAFFRGNMPSRKSGLGRSRSKVSISQKSNESE